MYANWPMKTSKSKGIFLKKSWYILNNYFHKYEHTIIGDLNLLTSQKYLADFMKLLNLESVIRTPT